MKIVMVGRFIAVAASLCWLCTVAFAADKAPHRPYGTIPKIAVPVSGGFELPEFGNDTKINVLYLTKNGSLVAAFSFKEHGILKSDMYDFATRHRLFPDQAERAANDNSIEFNFAKTHALEQLYPLSSVTFGKNRQVGQSYEGGRICPNNPYTTVTEISDERQTHAFTIFQKREHPAVLHLDANCFTSDKVILRYDTPFFGFYSNENGFLAEGSRFLIWFDWAGHSRFFDHQGNFVIVPADKMKAVLSAGRREDGAAASAEAFRKADDLIDGYAGQQMKRPPHG